MHAARGDEADGDGDEQIGNDEGDQLSLLRDASNSARAGV
jgi:hypothetical protein